MAKQLRKVSNAGEDESAEPILLLSDLLRVLYKDEEEEDKICISVLQMERVVKQLLGIFIQ